MYPYYQGQEADWFCDMHVKDLDVDLVRKNLVVVPSWARDKNWYSAQWMYGWIVLCQQLVVGNEAYLKTVSLPNHTP
jgi:hypothetical protein